MINLTKDLNRMLKIGEAIRTKKEKSVPYHTQYAEQTRLVYDNALTTIRENKALLETMSEDDFPYFAELCHTLINLNDQGGWSETEEIEAFRSQLIKIQSAIEDDEENDVNKLIASIASTAFDDTGAPNKMSVGHLLDARPLADPGLWREDSLIHFVLSIFKSNKSVEKDNLVARAEGQIESLQESLFGELRFN